MPWGDAVRCRVALGRFVFRRVMTAGCAPSRAGRSRCDFSRPVVGCPTTFLFGWQVGRGAGEGRIVAASFGTGKSSVRLQSIGGRRTDVAGALGWRIFLPGPDDRGAGRRLTAGGRRGFALVHSGSFPDGRSCAKGDGMVFGSRENRRRYRVPIVQDGPFRWRGYLKPRRPDVAEVTLGIVRGSEKTRRCGPVWTRGAKTFGAGFGRSLCVAPPGAESLGETLESPGVRTDVRFGCPNATAFPFPRRGSRHGGFGRRGRNGICGMSVS